MNIILPVIGICILIIAMDRLMRIIPPPIFVAAMLIISLVIILTISG